MDDISVVATTVSPQTSGATEAETRTTSGRSRLTSGDKSAKKIIVSGRLSAYASNVVAAVSDISEAVDSLYRNPHSQRVQKVYSGLARSAEESIPSRKCTGDRDFDGEHREHDGQGQVAERVGDEGDGSCVESAEDGFEDGNVEDASSDESEYDFKAAGREVDELVQSLNMEERTEIMEEINEWFTQRLEEKDEGEIIKGIENDYERRVHKMEDSMNDMLRSLERKQLGEVNVLLKCVETLKRGVKAGARRRRTAFAARASAGSQDSQLTASASRSALALKSLAQRDDADESVDIIVPRRNSFRVPSSIVGSRRGSRTSRNAGSIRHSRELEHRLGEPLDDKRRAPDLSAAEALDVNAARALLKEINDVPSKAFGVPVSEITGGEDVLRVVSSVHDRRTELAHRSEIARRHVELLKAAAQHVEANGESEAPSQAVIDIINEVQIAAFGNDGSGCPDLVELDEECAELEALIRDQEKQIESTSSRNRSKTGGASPKSKPAAKVKPMSNRGTPTASPTVGGMVSRTGTVTFSINAGKEEQPSTAGGEEPSTAGGGMKQTAAPKKAQPSVADAEKQWKQTDALLQDARQMFKHLKKQYHVFVSCWKIQHIGMEAMCSGYAPDGGKDGPIEGILHAESKEFQQAKAASQKRDAEAESAAQKIDVDPTVQASPEAGDVDETNSLAVDGHSRPASRNLTRLEAQAQAQAKKVANLERWIKDLDEKLLAERIAKKTLREDIKRVIEEFHQIVKEDATVATKLSSIQKKVEQIQSQERQLLEQIDACKAELEYGAPSSPMEQSHPEIAAIAASASARQLQEQSTADLAAQEVEETLDPLDAAPADENGIAVPSVLGTPSASQHLPSEVAPSTLPVASTGHGGDAVPMLRPSDAAERTISASTPVTTPHAGKVPKVLQRSGSPEKRRGAAVTADVPHKELFLDLDKTKQSIDDLRHEVEDMNSKLFKIRLALKATRQNKELSAASIRTIMGIPPGSQDLKPPPEYFQLRKELRIKQGEVKKLRTRWFADRADFSTLLERARGPQPAFWVDDVPAPTREEPAVAADPTPGLVEELPTVRSHRQSSRTAPAGWRPSLARQLVGAIPEVRQGRGSKDSVDPHERFSSIIEKISKANVRAERDSDDFDSKSRQHSY